MAYDFTTLAPAWENKNASMWRSLRKKGIDDPDVIDFGVAEMKFKLAPMVMDAVIDQAKNGTFGYAFAPAEMKDAVVAWMEKRHNWKISPDDCLQTYGLVAAIGYAVRALTEPGDGILVLFPSYGPFPRTVLQNDRKLVKSELIRTESGYAIDFDDVEKKLASPEVKAFILCNPHNPTGRVWTKEELIKLSEMCLKNSVYIISDDIHADLVYSPNLHTFIASLGKEVADITVTLTAPSKTFSIAGMTISNVVVSQPELKEKVESIISRDMGHYLNAFGMAACQAAYEKGEAWVDELLTVLKGNVDLLDSFFKEKMPAVRMLPQEGTYLSWVDFSGLGLNEEELNSFLWNDAHFMSEKGADFGEGYELFHRINVGCPRYYLEKALQRLEAAAADRGLLK